MATAGRESWSGCVFGAATPDAAYRQRQDSIGGFAPRAARRGLSLAFRHGMDCWIGVVPQSDRRLVRLAGRLSVAQVPELLGACADVLPIELDLTDLVSADEAGLEALQRLRVQGVTLVGAPGYFRMKLDSIAERAPNRLPSARRP